MNPLIKRYWGLVGKLTKAMNITREQADDIGRTTLYNLTGRDSLKACTTAQLELVIQSLQARLDLHNTKPLPEKAIDQDANALPSPAQLQELEKLQTELKWDKAKLIAFCRGPKSIGIPWPQNRKQANKVIEALKAMANRKTRAPSQQQAEHWLEQLCQPPRQSRLTEWENRFVANLRGKRLTDPQRRKLQEIVTKQEGA